MRPNKAVRHRPQDSRAVAEAKSSSVRGRHLSSLHACNLQVCSAGSPASPQQCEGCKQTASSTLRTAVLCNCHPQLLLFQDQLLVMHDACQMAHALHRRVKTLLPVCHACRRQFLEQLPPQQC